MFKSFLLQFLSFFLLTVIVLESGYSQDKSQPQVSAPAVLSGGSTHQSSNAVAGNLKVVAYYTQWSVCDMPPQKFDWSAITHLIYFWGEPKSTSPYFSLFAGSSDSITFETGTPGWCTNSS
ncbi:MAG: hypothetical protein HYR67_13155, partial [Bacteroidetes bacterium]|nr:hypothetical protein [Bacteroidota bacterium]